MAKKRKHTEAQQEPKASDGVLSLPGFKWSTDVELVGDVGTLASSKGRKSKRISKHVVDTRATKTRNQKRHKRSDIILDRTATLDELPPENSEDFERLLLGSPNSSELWVGYMAYYLQMGDTASARQIADRALEVINFREEEEKLNIWLAYINLETATDDLERLDQIFERACSYADPKRMYAGLCNALVRSEKKSAATEAFSKMVARFSGSCKVWINYATYLMATHDVEAARDLVPRAIKSLPKRKHIKAMSKFAQLEFKYGDQERGRTIMEGILANAPKRLDQWSVLLDLEIKNAEPSVVRTVFKRMVTLKLSRKQAKYVLKRWLEFEDRHGTPYAKEQIMKLARELAEKMDA